MLKFKRHISTKFDKPNSVNLWDLDVHTHNETKKSCDLLKFLLVFDVLVGIRNRFAYTISTVIQKIIPTFTFKSKKPLTIETLWQRLPRTPHKSRSSRGELISFVLKISALLSLNSRYPARSTQLNFGNRFYLTYPPIQCFPIPLERAAMTKKL